MKRALLAYACGYALLAPVLLAVEVQAGGVPSTGVVGVAYSGTVKAGKGTAPYTFSLASGSLPNGLSLSSSGSITGTPSLAGAFNFVVRVTDNNSATATGSFTITIAPAPVPALTITTTSPLPGGTVGSPYSLSLSASGGSPPYRWSGAAPAGLILDSSGSITGTPNTAGNFNFTATVTDSASRTANRSFAIAIAPAPVPALTITTTSPLAAGTVGSPYSQSLSASGGSPPYRWSGAAPAGLTLDSSGSITGTPNTAGNFNFTATVTDSASRTANRSFTITIAPAPVPVLTITPTSPLPPGTVGSLYSQSLSATGGSPPYRWSGAVPAGLILDSNGSITGTPNTAGDFNFTATVTDSASRTANRSFTITIAPAPVPTLTITTAPLPPGTVGSPYSQSLSATGGSPPYRWSGAAPAGLILDSSGSITGTPNAAGDFNFTATVTDSASRTANRSFTITINPSPLTITTASPLAAGTVGSPYSQSLSATGGSPPYRWSGAAPAGLILDSSGSITGTPNAAGDFNFTATVTDNASRTANRSFTITINPSPLTITTASTLPAGLLGAPYSQVLSAAGGVPPYRWFGTTPTGLTLSDTGVISGTPSAVGSFNFTVTVNDSASSAANRSFAILIEAGALSITTDALPSGSTGVPYSQQLSANGGSPPLTWSITVGQLPTGLVLNPSTAAITGTPTAAGSFNFTVQARDVSGVLASKQLSISIEQGLTISTTSPLPGGTAGAIYSRTMQAAGGGPPYSWSITSGSLPTGLTLNSENGLLSGVPSAEGTATFTLQVKDSRAVTAGGQFTLTIARTLAITTVTLSGSAPGAAYSTDLALDGGTPPYAWSVSSGSMPTGLALDSTTGVIAGTTSASGQFSFAIQVTDAADASSLRQFSIEVLEPVVQPSLTVGSVPEVAAATQQLTVDLNLSSAAPSPVTGQVSMRFVPDAAIGADDPAVQFSTGGRFASFTIPVNATQPSSPIALQTGSVAGIIELQFSAPSAGVSGLTRTIRIARAAPAIGNLRVVRSTSGFELRLVGLSTSRELTSAIVRFIGTGLDTEVRVPLTDMARSWYQSDTSFRFGSQFALTLPFTVQGSSDGIRSATLTVTNGEGASQSLTVEFGSP